MGIEDNTKQNIGNLFNRIASTYDRLNHLLSLNTDRRWRRRAVRKLTPCNKALDVASGTADLAIEMVRQDRVQQVIGIDLSEEMLRLGDEKVRKADLASRITLQQGSALELPYPADQFDAVTCAYGVRNFSDLNNGLQEMHRVLREEGQLLILEFSYPDNKIIRFFYDFYFTKIMPAIGQKVSKDPSAYSYLNHSVKEFIWGEAMVEKLRAAGFRNVSFHPMTFGITTLYLAQK
ncbi:MAG: bifunctional demethylmenaquinone methyltransferase/2-methoxy-6-polyprenyl-1,4-benzoquinol methylase UbiE [Bacteroidales bacterium]|nr:bifunctional demethylmenaquinone methyltransferase/2-methoxy-6-polyprenyl-1,4-benzoquinol methylase UbiE [Bacteroidales bacterium]